MDFNLCKESREDISGWQWKMVHQRIVGIEVQKGANWTGTKWVVRDRRRGIERWMG